jgi:hypothetical protein
VEEVSSFASFTDTVDIKFAVLIDLLALIVLVEEESFDTSCADWESILADFMSQTV